ncbi:MAG: alpha-ribazole phosphatase [Paraglaciecola psychrophila]|jgi:alpha-ribazole phosphatase
MATTHSITTVDILRHGRTLRDDILRGRTDTALHPEGYQQMIEQAERLIAPDQSHWQQLFSSPLQRCRVFAEYISTQRNIPITIDNGFIEMDYGDWDGQTFTHIRATDGELFDNVWRAPQQYSPPNGERFNDFCQRTALAWQHMLNQHRGQNILLVSHGGVIKSLLGALLQAPLVTHSNIEVPYACISRIQIHHLPDHADWPQLVFHNR